MALRLEIVSQHRKALGERGVKVFGHGGGTIGRSLESDWVLPDAQRYLSSRHACIDFRSGSYYVVDTSMNGVYVNGARKPVGRGKPQRVFSGDRIRIGEYEMLVHIDEVDDTSAQLAGDSHRDPVDLAQRVPPPEPMGHDLVDPFEMTGVGFEEFVIDDAENNLKTMPHGEIEWILDREEESGHSTDAEAAEAAGPAEAAQTLTLESEPPPVSAAARFEIPERAKKATAVKASIPVPAAKANPAAKADNGPAAKSDEPSTSDTGRTETATANSGATRALDAFLRGAGIEQQSMTDDEALRTLNGVGQLMRELIVGITESLHVRAGQKNLLRLANTTIQPRNNNPLKFSAGVDEALHNLFFRQSGDYLSAVDAVREALRDIKTHQQIMLAALPAAMNEYINLLDPDELEQKFSGSAKRSALMGAASKFKYWDLYKDMYQVVAQRAPGQLPAQFVEELSRAYEQESGRRAGRGSDPPARAHVS